MERKTKTEVVFLKFYAAIHRLKLNTSKYKLNFKIF